MGNNEGPPQGDRTPRERGGIRLGVSAPPRHGRVITPDRLSPVPTLPRPDTRQSVPEQAPQKPKKHTVRNIALAGTALGALGIGVYEGYQNVPAVHREVDTRFLNHIRGKAITEASINAEVFDNNTMGGIIGSENTVVLSPEEIKRTLPPIIIDSVNNTSTILFPFQLPEGTKSQFTKTAIIPKDNPSSFSNQAEKVTVFSEILPIGTKIVNPIEGAHVFLQKGDPKLREDPNLVKRAIFYWYDNTNDQLYLFSVTPTILPGPMFKPVIQDDRYYNWNYDWETLPVADRGLEIMETTQNFQPVVVDVSIHKGKMNSLDSRMKSLEGKTSRFGNVDFFTTQRINSDGKTKLVVLGNQN